MPTKIEWTDETWNPVTGCTPGLPCRERCYARRMANRLKGRFGYDADEPFKPTFHEDKILQPVSWRKPRRIFISSMGDLFCGGVSDEWVERVIHTIRITPQHTYMILTKRPRRMGEWFKRHKVFVCENLWLGISASTQAELDERWYWLRQIPAMVRFVSLEPMLEEVDLLRIISVDLRRLDWVIIGPETGPGKRPMDLDWARTIRGDCQLVNIPFFYKPGPLDGVVWNEFPR